MWKASFDSESLWNRSTATPESKQKRATAGERETADEDEERFDTEANSNSWCSWFCPTGTSIDAFFVLRPQIALFLCVCIQKERESDIRVSVKREVEVYEGRAISGKDSFRPTHLFHPNLAPNFWVRIGHLSINRKRRFPPT